MTESVTSVPFEQKISEGGTLKKKLVESGLALARGFPMVESSDQNTSNRRAVARSFLIASSQLAGQIIDAVSRGSLGLALIGLKTLFEYDVSANFIFDHPTHRQDFSWIDPLCKDIFDRTNDLSLPKNRLGDSSVKDRCEAIDRADLYEKNYAGLNDYAHLVLRLNLLNERVRFEKLSVDVVSHALCHLVGAIDAVNTCFSLGWDTILKTEVISYRDRFESPPD